MPISSTSRFEVLGGPESDEAIAWAWAMPPARHSRLANYRVGYVPDEAMSPLTSEARSLYENVLSQLGKAGATLVAGGPGRPDGLDKGFYVRPTVFGDVTPQMRIAREEIFGPVLSILLYETEDEAVEIANDTPFGLAGFVQSKDPDHARSVANRIRAGRVYLNGAPFDRSLPFGGYKQSGNGREFGRFGFEEYLEVKAVLGYPR